MPDRRVGESSERPIPPRAFIPKWYLNKSLLLNLLIEAGAKTAVFNPILFQVMVWGM